LIGCAANERAQIQRLRTSVLQYKKIDHCLVEIGLLQFLSLRIEEHASPGTRGGRKQHHSKRDCKVVHKPRAEKIPPAIEGVAPVLDNIPNECHHETGEYDQQVPATFER
jgi:hypothetical protein